MEAMGRERYRLRAHGEEQAAEELYEKRSLIEKHVEHAHEIVFNDRDSRPQFILQLNIGA